MRKFLLATLAAPVMAAATLLLPAAAAQATTSTTTHSTDQTFNTGAAVCLPGDLIITGNAVLHQTVNNAGHSVINGTITGAAVTTGTPAATGHATALFGDKTNNQNFAGHFMVNAQLTLPDGSAVSIQQQGLFIKNANGTIVVTISTTTCG
jgi:hypothetical protein